MKNLIYGVLTMSIIALAFACKKDATTSSITDSTQLMTSIANSSNKQAVTVAQLPTSVREYVALSFTPIEIDAAWHVTSMGYEVELEDGQNLYFRENGGCMGTGLGGGGGVFRCMHGDTVDVSELPQAAVDYIAANYAGTDIVTVVYKQHGDRAGYAVELSDGNILLFNGTGDFFSLCGDFDGDGDGHGDGPGNGGGPGHHDPHGDGPHGNGDGPHGTDGGCAAGDTIATADLPQVIADYISSNYAGETITVVVVKPSGKFGVELSSSTVLLFTADGTFIKECDGQPADGPHQNHCNTPISLTDLPQAAQDYISTNYADAILERGCLKNNGNYIVRLSNHVVILFAADGTVIFDSGM
ncbi:MAG: hypothetical protein GC192_06025 [Bacteroidetes bacterium]|nr:hypothetical protein [Bacteroidota bacterium]